MKPIYRYLSLAILVILLVNIPQSCRLRWGRNAEAGDSLFVKDTVYPLGFCTDSFDVEVGSVKTGEIFAALFSRLGMTHEDALLLADASDSVFDSRKMRAGNSFEAYYSTDTLLPRTLQYLVYEQNRIDRTIFRCTPPYEAWNFSKEVKDSLTYLDVEIRTSLWNDMVRKGASPSLITRLAEIYAWSVDFFGLQEGDRFTVLYNQKTSEGTVLAVDTIYYSLFQRDTLEVQAIRFDQGDDGNLYWKANGESLMKAFLKAPLKFTRISSGFSYHRRHPVHGDVRAHTGVDYAAPTGTPVVALGDGVVVFKGWAGGGGNTVRIRHNSVYTTGYMHLSRYAKGLKEGTHVRQGEVIGYVGMTGTATGPHLDFRVWENGTPINPLNLKSPSADPIQERNLPALDSVYHYWRHVADSLGSLSPREVVVNEADLVEESSDDGE